MANWLSGYTTRKKITIDKSKIDADLTDFPVLVKLTSSNFDFSKANSDGFDLRFTSSDGTTLLKYERERHDATNKLAEYWVKIPSISSTANTIFYLYYRVEDTDDGADPTNVWDSNFKGVWHMKDLTTSTIEDSTSNNNDGTKKAANEPTQADGQIAKAQNFDGTNDYIQTGDAPSLDISGTSPITEEAWVKIDTIPSTHPYAVTMITETGNLDTTYDKGIKITTAGKATFYVYDGSIKEVVGKTTLATGTWYHLVGLYNGTNIKIYVNGVDDESASVTATKTYNFTTPQLVISLANVINSYVDGIIDEVRISNTARSAAWIKASYYSGNNSLVSYGSEEGIDNAVFFGINL